MFKDFIHKITKNKYYLFGVISVFLLLIISLGTAALRSTLSIYGTTKIKENSWMIYFDHVHDEQFTDNVTPEKHAIIVDQEKSRIEFTVDLKPGEVYEYTVDMINDGTVNATIESIEKYQLTDAQKKYLDFEIQYTEGPSAGLEPKVCDRLDAGTKREIKVSVRYKKGLDAELYPSENLHLNLYFDITYIQEVLTCPDEPTAHKLTVDPNGGTFKNYKGQDRKDNIVQYLMNNSDVYSSTFVVPTPTSNDYNFDGWEVVYPDEGTYTLNGNNFTIGNEDVYLKAKWKEGNYVARIEDHKFETIQMAFDAADGSWIENGSTITKPWTDNTVHLIKSTTEYPTNNTTVPFIFDLEGLTVFGRINNSANGKLTLINGVVQELEDNQDDSIEGAVVNYGTFTMGLNDGFVDVENSVSLKGDEVGLSTENAKFYFYDGYIEGDIAYLGDYVGPENYYVFINEITNGNKKIQRAYLVNNYTRAVVKTQNEDGTNVVVYYTLQTGIDRVIKQTGKTKYQKTLRAIRDFEAAYDITVPENENIDFDLEDYRVWTGANVTNNGTFNIYSSKNERANIKAYKTFTNNGTLLVNNIKMDAMDDVVLINNKGSLDLKNSEIHGQHTYAVSNIGEGTILFDEDTFIDSKEQYGLYNSSANLNITDGTIYGFYNEANSATVSGGNFKVYHWTTQSWYTQDHYIPAISNAGTLNVTGGNVTENTWETHVVQNKGTMNITGGTFDSIYRTFNNNYDSRDGILNISGGDIHSRGTVVYSGSTYITNNAEIGSDNGNAIEYGYLEVNNGKVSVTNGSATNNSNVKMTAGEIVTENGTAITGNNNQTITVNGGIIHSLEGTAISGSHVNITSGTIEGTTYGIQNGANVNISGGSVLSDDKAITCSSINITGGEITSPNDAVVTTNLNITSGKVESENGNAITVNGEGTILDGEIHGGMYGVLNNGKITIGEDDGEISPNVPTIIGESVGVYITGTDTYFFDGILKGEIDGYVGEITRTPLGGTPAAGIEEIEGVTYQTDYIIQFEPWLEIEGVGTFNTIDAASSAIGDGESGTIKVIADVIPSFIQHFKDENHNKNITFDLNGHTLRSTQVAYNNESNVTVIDSVGTGKITNDICNYFENDYVMDVDGVTMISSQDKAAIRNYRHGTLTINNANITAHKCGVQSMGEAILNSGSITSEETGICLELIDTLYDHAYGNFIMNGGTINATLDGVNIGYGGGFTLNGGSVTAGRYGAKGMSTTINDGTITSQDVTIFGGGITVNGGTVKSINNHALYANSTITVTGGYVEGTTAIAQYPWYDFYSHPRYEPIDITGGKVVGKTENGINLTGNTLTITGGEVYGEVDGIKSQSHVVLGTKEDAISKEIPIIQGKHNGITTTGTFHFFDGILKGRNLAREGQVNLVPDASMVVDDYEFIDRVEYKTEYLESYGNWLRVGEQEFNSLYAAQEVIEDYGTVYVTKDVSINFEQSLVSDKHVTLDLDGHQVMMMKTLTTKGTNTIADSSTNKTGLIRNISEVEDLSAVTNEGNLTIAGGEYDSVRVYAINNSGTMIVNELNLTANGCINNLGNLEINNAHLSNTTSDRSVVYNRGTLTINGGEITSNYSEAIRDESNITVNGGIIESTIKEAITSTNYYGPLTINGGEIKGKTNGIVVESSDRNDLSITGGKIIGETGTGVISSGWRTYVTGGTLEGKVYGLSLSDGGTIGANDGTVVIDTPIIKGDTYGLNVSGGTLNFNDGILKGITNSIQGLITNIPAGTQEYNDTEVIDGKTYQTKYLIQEKDLVYNVEKDTRYNNLQVAFDEAEEGNTLELLTNIPIYYLVTNNNSNGFILDLKGYSISTNKSIVNNGRLTITDSETNVGTIKTSSSINLITNTNNLTINKVNLINNSSSNYIVSNNGTLEINETIINGINSVSSSGTLTINNAEITGSNAGVSSSGNLTINKGTYRSDSTAIYSSGTGTNEIIEAVVNGKIQNTRGTLEIKKTIVNFNSKNDYRYPDEAIENSGIINIIQNTQVLGKGRLSNSGTMNIDRATIDINSSMDKTYPTSMIYNSGVLDIDNTNITLDKNYNRNESRGITNTGTLRIHENVTMEIGTHDKEAGGTHYGILTSDHGNTIVDGTTIKVHGMNTAYGIYIDGTEAKAVVLSGDIEVTDTKYAYGAYTTRGTFELGVFDEIEDESDLVSQTNPRIYAVGDIRGIGVKKVNGNFNFYDGILWASTYAKPETTTIVQHLYEVTTYMDEETSLEYALLEFMGSDYDDSVVAMIGQRSFRTLQSAIDAENESNEEIVLVRSIETEEPLNIPTGKNIVIDLHGMSLTTSIENNGTLQLYNGTIIETGVDNPETEEVEEHNYINNYGTLILGKDDGVVSSSNTRIVSEGLAINKIYEDEYIHNEGRFEMYDGYIEGNPAINGSIDKIAEFARLYTKKDKQYERIYLQSLSEDAIRNKETALIVSVDPNGGIYNESEEVQTKFLYYEEELLLKPNPTKHASIFDGWEINDTGALSYDETEEAYKVTVGLRDIELKAKWIVDPNAVAKIGDKYYYSIQEANDNAVNGDTIELIKDYQIGENEVTTINKEVTLDLGGYTYTGPLINNGILTIYHGTISNPNGIGVVNNKTITLGKNDGEIDLDGTRIYGRDLGLEQNGRFNYYDGNIEGIVAINGGVNSLPHGFHLYTESIETNDPPTQRAILTGNPANAVAIIKGETSDLDQYFFKLTDAISSAALSNKEIDIIRSFNAAYPIEIKDEHNIIINMNSYNITTGNTFVVNGSLKLYDKSETKGSITFAQTISNNGVLSVEDITLLTNQDRNLLTNNGILNLTKAKLQASTGYAVYFNDGDIIMDADSLLTSNTYALYNNGTLTLSNGEIKGVYNAKDLTLTDNIYLHQTTNNACLSSETSGAVLTTTGGRCESSNIGFFFTRSVTANIDNFEIVSTNQGIRYGSNDYYLTGIVNINNSSITSTNSYGIETYDGVNNWNRKITIRNSTIKGSSHAIVGRSSHTYIYDSLITSTTGAYSIYMNEADVLLYSGARIESDIANGIYLDYSGYAYLYDGSLIKLTREDATGVLLSDSNYGNLTMNNGSKIEVPGEYSYGVNCTGYYKYLYMNGGEIESGNIGVRFRSYYYNTNDKNEINIKGGSIYGDTYGLYVYADRENININIGNNADELDQQIPLISGGFYGIYKEAGNINFYNGRLKGHVDASNSAYSIIKSAHDVAVYNENTDDYNDVNTYTTTTTSTTPLSNTPKAENGYAQVTYMGETFGDCIEGTVYSFDYNGDEQELPITCPGKYKLEVWGAQGGSATTTYIGGYGGYATGEIDLNVTDTLYINVGGQGKSCSGSNCKVTGGYNGGGDAYANNYCDWNIAVGSGGGATHIALKSGLLNTLENDKDKILIVAGGGGGSNYCNGVNYADGGSGGGYKGANSVNRGARDWAQNGGLTTSGGTQESGFAFGQGAGSTTSYIIGGGGGFYGGKGSSITGSGGGSGYIANTRLTNKSMYGYKVKATNNHFIHNYLVEKEHFLQTNDGETFNSITVAANYIKDNIDGTGKMTVIADATLQEVSTIPSDVTVEIDLNGKHISSNQVINNNGNLTISDSSNDYSGLLENTATTIINNYGPSLTLEENVKLKTVGTAVYSTKDGTTITQKAGSKIEAATGYNLRNSTTLNITGAEIKTTGTGIAYGSDNYSQVGRINITDSEIISSGGYAIETYDGVNNWNRSFNITGSTIKGASHAIVGRNAGITISDSLVESTGTNWSVYLESASMTLNDGARIESDTGNGVDLGYDGHLTLNNGSLIKLTREDGTGVIFNNNNYGSLTMNDGSKIEVPGISSYGINNDGYNRRININGGEVISGNIGIKCRSYYYSSNDTNEINIYGGTISATGYGIYTFASRENININIGKDADELSQTNPMITGSYAIYKEAGNINFYNGRLRGTTETVNTEFNKLKHAMKVVSIDEYKDPLDETSTLYHSKYLESMEDFIEVNDGTRFNSITDAANYIKDNLDGTGKMTVIADATLQEVSTIPSDVTVEIDLNGKHISSNQVINNNGNLTISDSSNDYSGLLENTATTIINNYGPSLTLEENVKLKTVGTAVYSTKDGTTITQKAGSKIEAATGYNLRNSTTLNITGAEIKTTGTGIAYGSDNYSQVGRINITDSEIISSGGYAIETYDGVNNWNRSFNITGSTIKGASHAIVGRNAGITISDSLVESTGTNWSVYLESASMTLNDGARIESDTGNGVDLGYDGHLTLNNGSLIKLTREDGTGVIFNNNNYGSLTMNDGSKIEVPGISSYGINNDGYNRRININGGEVISGNIGIKCRSYYYSSNDTNEINIYGGTVEGSVYGIYTFASRENININIGKSSEELDQQIPYITGGLYGIYKEAGNINFYNGRLRGGTAPYNGDISNVRDNHQVYLTTDELTTKEKSYKTVSTTSFDEDPIANTPKKGNGYARVQYLGNNDQVIDYTYADELINEDEEFIAEYYDYKGSEDVFTAPDDGVYILELWGAQGGGSGQGYGGYSTGTIYLNKNEKLYINVGGTAVDTYIGGYNGGGNGGSGNGQWSYAGGGATSIATSSGLLSNLSNNRDSIIIVAAGGGGNGSSSDSFGGSGGGYIGTNGYDGYNRTYNGYNGYGADQTQGGYAASCGTGTRAGFGAGANFCNSGYGGAGGGGGYFGGGGSNRGHGGGGGGSSYIANSNLHNKYTYCYNCQTSDDVNTKTLSDGANSCHSSTATKDCAKEGNGYVKITRVDAVIDNADKEFDYTGQTKTYTVPYNGVYKLEVWGAQGGSIDTSQRGGYGSYSVGEITLSRNQMLYINVGGHGAKSNNGVVEGGFNGGGNGHSGSCNGSGNRLGASGGGATSIAMINGEISTLEDYKGTLNNNNTEDDTSDDYYESNDILIVAGGGGGGFNITNWLYGPGGSGGGYIGVGGTHNYTSETKPQYAKPGTQTTFGTGGDAWEDLANRSEYFFSLVNGKFGKGGDTTSWDCSEGGGGGGGFFGGGAGSETSGAAGSGYIASPNLSEKHMYCYDCSTSDNTNTKTLSNGTNSCHSSNPTEDCAKENNGYAKISLVSTDDLLRHTVTLVYDYGQMDENIIYVDRGTKIGVLPSPTNYGNYYFDGWFTDRTYTKKVNKDTIVRGDATLYAKFIPLSDFCNNSYVYDFEYQGVEETLSAPCTGKYKLETWGASGGSYNATYHGGYGSYSIGYVDLNAGENLYINVGGQGSLVTGTHINAEGGYNGGGYAHINYSSTISAGSGGGATHIATSSGLLSTLENKKNDILIVSGGGAGSSYYYDSNAGFGGSGGGYIGGSGESRQGTPVGTGGTQAGPGHTSGKPTSGLGSFGQGASNEVFFGAGGGGYYGGGYGSDNANGGGGGSGYIGNSRLYDKAMYGYNVRQYAPSENMTIAYLIPTVDFIYNKTIDKSYSNFTEAFSVANDGDEFELLVDASITMPSTIANARVSLDLKGHDLYVLKTITNNGNLTIYNSDTSKNPKIYSNFSIDMLKSTNELTINGIELSGYNTIVNTGTLTLNGVTINSTNNAVNTSKGATITDSIINASNYAYYESGSTNSSITNTPMKGTVQHESTGGITVTGSSITGNINNTNGIFNISGQQIKGGIGNSSTMTVGGLTISSTYTNYNTYRMISNSGTLTLSNNTITTNNTYGNDSYDTDNVFNSGTLNSTGNTYNVYSSGRHKYSISIENNGILTSNFDVSNAYNGNYVSSIYNANNGTANITNLTSTIYNGNDVSTYNNRNGTLTITGGTHEIYDSTNANGVIAEGGTVNIKGGTYSIHDISTGNGIYINTGTANLESGSFDVKGTTVYGVRIASATGTLNLGVSGTPVNVDNPFISAVGTTKGIGISMGNGIFNFYDGKITGNTRVMDENNIETSVEQNYQVVNHPADADNPYPYNTLEIIY